MTEQIEMPEESLAPRGAGPQLRLAREKLGLSVKDVAARTRISQRHVENIEAGNFSEFPSRTYVIGFARTIARELGLDPEKIVGEVRAELNTLQPNDRQARQAYEPGDPARVPSQRLVWVSVAALAILLAGLFMAARTLFSPAAELPSLIAEEEQVQAETGDDPAVAATPAPSASGAVVFTATRDDIWVRFYDADGQRMMEGELDAGQSYAVPAGTNGPMIWTGHPDALTITIDGQPVPPLATQMVTMRDVPVDAASLLARTVELPPARSLPISQGSRTALRSNRPAAAATPAPSRSSAPAPRATASAASSPAATPSPSAAPMVSEPVVQAVPVASSAEGDAAGE